MAKDINQKRGPTVGNAGNASKRNAFMDAKDKSSSERAVLATMVTDALAARGRGQRGTTNPALEGVHGTTNVGRGPTRGNAGRK